MNQQPFAFPWLKENSFKGKQRLKTKKVTWESRAYTHQMRRYISVSAITIEYDDISGQSDVVTPI